MRAFPSIRDLVTDVSWAFAVKKEIAGFKPRPPDAPDGTWRMQQEDIERVQEFRKCIECFLCQDVCHVLRDHHLHEKFIGPRFLVHVAALEMHPLDVEDRLPALVDGTLGLLGHPGEFPACPRGLPLDQPVTLAIGPEGGWIPYEVDKLREAGLQPVQLGERILRVETAVTALLARLY